MAKKALITGITGQDGSYLAENLLSKGYKVYGLLRRTSQGISEELEHLAAFKRITLLDGNLRDLSTVRHAMEAVQPDEVYNLAAQSHVGVSFKCPDETYEINYFGVGRIVQTAMTVNPNVRIYQASTSEMYGSTPPPQNEESSFNPVSPYAEAKLKAHEEYIVGYREKYGLFACSGILFNHESPRRGKQFVTRKITRGLAKVKLGLAPDLELGNLEAKRDWGFAGDYVEAMRMILQQERADDFVIATGEAHSVRDFVNAAANALEMSITWEGEGLQEVGHAPNGDVIVRINEEFYRPHEVQHLLGDASKARNVLGWKPTVSFPELVVQMVKSDFDDLQLRGV